MFGLPSARASALTRACSRPPPPTTSAVCRTCACSHKRSSAGQVAASLFPAGSAVARRWPGLDLHRVDDLVTALSGPNQGNRNLDRGRDRLDIPLGGLGQVLELAALRDVVIPTVEIAIDRRAAVEDGLVVWELRQDLSF